MRRCGRPAWYPARLGAKVERGAAWWGKRSSCLWARTRSCVEMAGYRACNRSLRPGRPQCLGDSVRLAAAHREGRHASEHRAGGQYCLTLVRHGGQGRLCRRHVKTGPPRGN
jgi:hypothetical protein